MIKRFPLSIIASKDRVPLYKATTSIGRISEGDKSVRHDLNYVEQDYSVLIKAIRESLLHSHSTSKKDPRVYWLIGDNLVRFLERINDLGFYLAGQNQTLARDLGVTARHVRRVIAFRKHFPNIRHVNPMIPWAQYKNNKVPLPEKK